MKLVAGNRVRVNVFASASTTAAGRLLVVSVARCTGSASSPTCPAAVSSRITLPKGRTTLQKTFTVARPASKPDALRVMVMVTRSASSKVPFCSAGARPGTGCKGDKRFVLAGDLLMSGGTWRYSPGTRFGTVSTVPGIQLEEAFFNSRTYTWTHTSAAPAAAVTTIGYPNKPPARTYTDSLRGGVRKVFDRTPSVGTAFERRTSVQTLLYATAIDGTNLFSMRVPVPRWTE